MTKNAEAHRVDRPPLRLSQIKVATGSGFSIVENLKNSLSTTEVILAEVETMAANAGIFQFIRQGAGVLAILCLLAPTASADCARDSYGEIYCGGGRCLQDRKGTIWCSRAYEGGAEKTRDGSVLCGKGQCAKDSSGQIFCSSVVGGAALKDSQGRVRCYSQCEPATAAQCENTRAGVAG
ncbi:MAG: hypothetical protein OEM98_14375 [Gammaproteobacteria bacterium]|nr:hypothetical protein [Gammaproteobacteria bacterium]